MMDEKRVAEVRREVAAYPSLLTPELFSDALATIERLWRVVRSAEKLIYPPRKDYAPGSKKAGLRDALEALKPQ